MPLTNKPVKESYTEVEAAAALGITLERLRGLLDTHLFNDGTPHPDTLTLLPSDLVLIGFWNKTMVNPKVVRMPRRN
jgi:hypothetical protein